MVLPGRISYNMASIDFERKNKFHRWWRRFDNHKIKPCFIRASALEKQKKLDPFFKIGLALDESVNTEDFEGEVELDRGDLREIE